MHKKVTQLSSGKTVESSNAFVLPVCAVVPQLRTTTVTCGHGGCPARGAHITLAFLGPCRRVVQSKRPCIPVSFGVRH